MSAPLFLADAALARREAAAILRQSRFHNPSVPRPLHSLLHDLGSVVQRVGHAVASVARALGRVLPGGAVTAWVLLGVLVVGLVALVAGRYTRRALAGPAGSPQRGGRGRGGAADLEREADEAERAGRYAEAVRLRFRAGLQRLSEQGAIARPASTPTAEVSRALDSPGFAALARRFDEIAYGDAVASEPDARAARDGWPDVVAGARRR